MVRLLPPVKTAEFLVIRFKQTFATIKAGQMPGAFVTDPFSGTLAKSA
jgi:hypothetical protein